MTLIATPQPLIVDHHQPPPGSWEREVSHFPFPLTAFTKSLMLMEEWGRQISAEGGALIDTVRFIEIDGWVYSRVVPFRERPGAPTPPDWLVPLLLRLVPATRRRIATAKAALDGDWSGRQIDTWYDRRQELGEEITALRRADLRSMDDGALDAHLRAAISLAHTCLELHFRLHGAMAHSLRSFTATCHELLGWNAGRSLSMLAGTSTASTDAGRALTELARVARRSDRVCRLIGDAPPEQVLAADADFAAAFAEYRDRYCFRALTYDLSDPTLLERPEIVLSLVRDQLSLVDRARPEPGGGTPVIEQARAALATSSAADRTRFEEGLADALRVYPVREDNAYLTVCAPFALVRMAALELGRRLADRGTVAVVDDVFLLYVDEARSALIDGVARHEVVARRRGDRQRTLAHPGPQRYGPPPAPPPALHRLPAPARIATEDGLWLIDLMLTSPPDGEHRPVITGVAAARGTAHGPVRVISDESQFDKLRAGDVLVCECTSPAWSIVFPSLSAVVTDSGGILSHPAIVAREFGIPAVVATGDATARLRDGQQVVVDGTAGTVRVVP
jgi:pyruvate,water dikinase